MICCLLSAGGTNAFGQSLKDTLREVHIQSARIKKLQEDIRNSFSAGQQNQKIDSAIQSFYQNRSLAQLIAEQSSVFVKTYGVNGMATLSFRGASAAQSAVLWNGVPLSNPSLGMADISLLHTGLFDDISLQYGSSSALYGSGNVGGALLLEDKPADFSRQEHAALTLGAGSFGKKDIALKTVFQNERWRFKWNTFYEAAKNDFPYCDAANHLEHMENAHASGFGSIFSIDYNLDKKNAPSNSGQVISLQLWYQQFDRQIPPALFEAASVKQQLDRSFRSLLHWQKTQYRSSFYAKISYDRDYLHYQDGQVLPDNENSVMQIYGEAGWRWRIDDPERISSSRFPLEHHLLLFAPLQYARATGQNLMNGKEQFRPALVLAYDLNSYDSRFKADAMLRQEWQGHHAPATLPGLGMSYLVFQKKGRNSLFKGTLRVNAQKSYRVPTLNELYFSPGGNENLKPENGWNEDGGFSIQYEFQKNKASAPLRNKWMLQQETSFFNRNIKDWIYWLGGAIWTPHNLAEVHSRGIETNSSLTLQHHKLKLQCSVKTAYVLSTTVASYLPNDGSIGKQIPYTPRYNTQLGFSLYYAGFFLNYSHIYTGYRFTTVDESQYLAPYQTGNIQTMYAFQWGRYNFKFAAQVLNLFDARYQVVNGRPMPGRNFLISLQATL
jgi:iron complex outermembrane receptor protein